MKVFTLQSRLTEKEIKLIQAKLDKAESADFTNDTKEQILQQIKTQIKNKF